MDLLQLEHFLAVVEERTFTRAAERVFRTQSAVSQSIKKLEDEVGVSLFARDPHDVSLTEAGKTLVEWARKMVQARDNAVRELNALKTLKSGTVSIAAHESAAVYLLPPALRRYFAQFPDIKVGIYRSQLDDIPRRVMDREAHIGFVKDQPTFHELEWVDVHSDEMVLIAAPGHPLARRREVRIADLAAEPFILHHVCRATEQMIMQLFERHGTQCHVVAEVWSFENIKSFVQAEVGLAIVPKVTVRRELLDGSLIRVRVPELNIRRRTLMIYREQGYVSDSARELIKIVKRFKWATDVLPPRVATLQRHSCG